MVVETLKRLTSGNPVTITTVYKAMWMGLGCVEGEPLYTSEKAQT